MIPREKLLESRTLTLNKILSASPLERMSIESLKTATILERTSRIPKQETSTLVVTSELMTSISKKRKTISLLAEKISKAKPTPTTT